MPLPTGADSVARVLVAANEARAQLADRAAASASLAQLQVYEPALTAANALVENAVRVLRGTLGLPPPKTS